MIHNPDGIADEGGQRTVGFRASPWWILIVLTTVSLLNYIDRYVVASLVSDLTSPSPGGLGISDMEAGWLGSGFVVVYLITAPLFGVWSDRGSRPKIIALGVILWALATVAGGFATSFEFLFVARCLVGIGEAAYATAAPAILADAFPKRMRGRVFAIFFASVPVGAAIGYALGGAIDEHFGWRAAFFVAGAPGLAVALLVFFLRDPERGVQDREEIVDAAIVSEGAFENPHVPQGVLRSYLALFRIRSYTTAVLGFAAYTFALGALAFWMPDYLEKERGFSRSAATVEFGASFAVMGLLATLVGGWLADALLKKTRNAYMWVCGISMLLGVPFVSVAFLVDDPVVFWICILAAEFLLFLSSGPINSAIVNIVKPTDRAKAMAACILVIHLLGDVPSPPLVGYIAERSGLAHSMWLITMAILVSGCIWTCAAWRSEGEDRRARSSPVESGP